MRRDLWFNAGLSAGAYLLPLAGHPECYKQPSPWIALSAAVVTLFTQPALTAGEMLKRDSADRQSAVWIFAAMFAAQLIAVLDFGYFGHPAGWSWAMTVGLVLATGGLAFRIWSIRTLGQFFTATVTVQSGQSVITTGPYRLLRHPSYTGAILTAVGTCLVLGSFVGVAAVALLVVPAYIYRMRAEEHALQAKLGDAYTTYMRATRRLVPFVY